MSYSTFLPPSNQSTRRRRSFNGGFSSSLCSLFSNPSRNHADCCSLACCGLLQSDLNQYRIAQTPPPPWWKRLAINLGIPLLTLVVLNTTNGLAPLYGMLVFSAVIILLCLRGWYYRYQERRDVMKFMYSHRRQENEEEFSSVEDYLQQNQCNNILSTAVCGCVPADDDSTAAPQPNATDFCTVLWNVASSLCCGALCRCWCQCCGMCAIGQQDREIQQLLLLLDQQQDDNDMQVDYITFQPVQEYSFQLQQLRTLQVTSFWKHATKMSQLSYKLLYMLASSLVVLAVLALFQVHQTFTLDNLLVVRMLVGIIL